MSTSGNVVTVLKGNTALIEVKPSSGYRVKDVKIDGVSNATNQYIVFNTINADHTVDIVFMRDMSVKINGGDITPAVSSKDGSTKAGYAISTSVDVSVDFGGGVSSTPSGCSCSVTASYNFGEGTRTVSLVQGSDGKWHFPMTTGRANNTRNIYIPVNAKDGRYTITYNSVLTDEDGNSVTNTWTSTVVVKGTMYEDDFTGDRR